MRTRKCSLLCVLFACLHQAGSDAPYLRIADYAPDDYFTAAHPVRPAYNFTETFIGAGLDNMSHDAMFAAFASVSQYATKFDASGLVVDYRVLSVERDLGARIVTDGNTSAASVTSTSDSLFQGVQLVVESSWCANSTKIRETGFDTVKSQQGYAALFQIAVNITLRENWVNDMRIYPESAPVWARLPLGNLTGYQATLELLGPNMYPFDPVKQHIFMSALFEPLQAVCNAVTADLTEVSQSTLFNTSVNITIAFTIVFGECVLDKGLSSALANQTFSGFMESAGLPLTRATSLWAQPDYGVSVLEQAAQAGYPSTVYQPVQATVHVIAQAAPSNKEIVLVLCSSLGGLVAIGLALLVLIVTRTEVACQYDTLRWTKDRKGDLVMIGSGNFGKVHMGVLNKQHKVAIKTLQSDSMPEIHRFEAEVRILQDLHNLPHIVKCYPYNPRPTRGKQRSQFVMELMEGGDLSDALHRNGRTRLEWASGGRDLALQIALGVSHLHERKVVHCDLKPKNVLLNREWTVAKIGDVGLARMKLDTHLSTTSTVYGTFMYAAPEVLLRKRCDEKVDIFSLGMVLSEMLSGQFSDRYHVVDLMISDKAVAGIVRDCCQADPCLRPSARQVYERLAGSSPEAHSALGNRALRQADLV
ncbi:g9105 [Coccomyxa viridis]|uniref:G9105 protein n=1 Tax=Coccomyxa viridis TaxID=1274662 RepID=A0ABP1G4N0_9CHLO